MESLDIALRPHNSVSKSQMVCMRMFTGQPPQENSYRSLIRTVLRHCDEARFLDGLFGQTRLDNPLHRTNSGRGAQDLPHRNNQLRTLRIRADRNTHKRCDAGGTAEMPHNDAALAQFGG